MRHGLRLFPPLPSSHCLGSHAPGPVLSGKQSNLRGWASLYWPPPAEISWLGRRRRSCTATCCSASPSEHSWEGALHEALDSLQIRRQARSSCLDFHGHHVTITESGSRKQRLKIRAVYWQESRNMICNKVEGLYLLYCSVLQYCKQGDKKWFKNQMPSRFLFFF